MLEPKHDEHMREVLRKFRTVQRLRKWYDGAPEARRSAALEALRRHIGEAAQYALQGAC